MYDIHDHDPGYQLIYLYRVVLIRKVRLEPLLCELRIAHYWLEHVNKGQDHEIKAERASEFEQLLRLLAELLRRRILYCNKCIILTDEVWDGQILNLEESSNFEAMELTSIIVPLDAVSSLFISGFVPSVKHL